MSFPLFFIPGGLPGAPSPPPGPSVPGGFDGEDFDGAPFDGQAPTTSPLPPTVPGGFDGELFDGGVFDGPGPPIPPFKVALVAFLKASPSITALVAKVQPIRPSETSTGPFLTYRVTERKPGTFLAGDVGIADASVDFEARSTSYGTADQVVLALSALFHGKYAWSMAGLPVLVSTAASDSDDYAAADDASDDGTFSDTLTVNFRYRTR